jgi:hypothetical protein
LREFRWWISLLFIVSTLLCGGPHHHARDEIASMIRPESGCGDDCAHFAGHEAPDLSQISIDCDACHHRSETSGLLLQAVLFFQHLRSDRLERSDPVASIRLAFHCSSRAPPGILA